MVLPEAGRALPAQSVPLCDASQIISVALSTFSRFLKDPKVPSIGSGRFQLTPSRRASPRCKWFRNTTNFSGRASMTWPCNSSHSSSAFRPVALIRPQHSAVPRVDVYTISPVRCIHCAASLRRVALSAVATKAEWRGWLGHVGLR